MPKLNMSLARSDFAINALGVIAAGAIVGLITAQTRASDTNLMLQTYATFIALSIFSYSIGLLLMVRKESMWLRLPIWVWIAFLGSIANFLIIHLIPDLQYVWKFRNSSVIGYASGAIMNEIVSFTINVFINTLIAMSVLIVVRGVRSLTANRAV